MHITLLLNVLAFCSSVYSSTLPIAARNVCNADNCLRAMIATGRTAAASSFCQSYMSMHAVTSIVSTVALVATAHSTNVQVSILPTTTTDVFSTTVSTTTTMTPPALILYRIAASVDAAAEIVSSCGTTPSRLSSACNCFNPGPSTTYVTWTAQTSTTTAITSTTTKVSSTLIIDRTSTLVVVATATTPATCVSGGIYQAEDGTILELSCLTDFPGYSASSQSTPDLPSCMETCATANTATFGSCVGVSYDYSTSTCALKYGIGVSGIAASPTVHSARIMPLNVGPCLDESMLWGDIFIPSGGGPTYTMFCAYNHPDGDQAFYCGAGANDVDECAQLCTGNNANANKPECYAAVFVPLFAPDHNCCLKSYYQPSDMVLIPSFYCDTARLNVPVQPHGD